MDYRYFGSVNDDIETIFMNLQNGEKIENKEVCSFLLPKLSEEESKLVEKRDEKYMETYLYHYRFENAVDVDGQEMKRSESQDKYVKFHC